MSRLNLGKTAPDLYKKVAELDQLANQHLQDANIAAGFAHLLKLRASQINQCAFCIGLHSQDALNSGESLLRIQLLNAWRETEYYSAKERAALALIEEMTLINHNQVSDHTYQVAEQQLNQAEMSAIEWLSIVINAWNRIAIASRYNVAPD